MDIPVVPPVPRIADYPGAVAVVGVVVMTAVALVIAKHFDQTGGQLTVSLMVVLAFIAVVAFCLLFNIPANDEVTPGVVGALVAAFGAVIAHWLGNRKS